MSEVILLVTVLFTAVLALSLVVERVMEVVKVGYNLHASRSGAYIRWTRRAERVAALLERRLKVLERLEPAAVAAALRRFDEMLLGSSANGTSVPVVAGDAVRAVGVRFATKTLGVLLGIATAVALQLDLVTALSGAAPALPGEVLTGIAIGLGSGPVHKAITTIERRRKEARDG